jgi:hypothetical protein
MAVATFLRQLCLPLLHMPVGIALEVLVPEATKQAHYDVIIVVIFTTSRGAALLLHKD